MSWFCENPWEDTSSLVCLDHCKAQTCDLVSTLLRQAPVFEFQNRIVRSAVPPPDANKFCCQGHHAKAFTAALCWFRV